MYPKAFQQLIDHFSSLPSIGPKMAERLVLYLFKQSPEKLDEFAKSLNAIHEIKTCQQCFNISQNNLCHICLDKNRDQTKICIIEEPLDLIPIERSQAYDGLYHVLGGTVEKNNDSLTINELLNYVENSEIKEVIIATNFTTEGDLTAMHLKRILNEFDVNVSRLARGLATGSDIEYADDMTLQSSLKNRERM
ncbi:MAG: recombination protein RecR [Candidatus Moranbacteria bacterium]|nr:recombination protein RecR [Candidatus Moranbacteria bacterium]